MNERIKELWRTCVLKHTKDPMNWQTVADDFAELIIKECVVQCEQVAVDADAMAKSNFVTDAGRMLHQGVWGGAKNCGAQIREHFGVEE